MNEIWDNEGAIRNEQNRHMSEKGIKNYWMSRIYKKIQDSEETEWREEVLQQPKLRTYRTLKVKLQLEPYLLSETNKKGRYLLTSLRTGSNRLRIEAGRWKKPKEPLERRLCMSCMSGEIEDEKHLLLHCHAYQDLKIYG